MTAKVERLARKYLNWLNRLRRDVILNGTAVWGSGRWYPAFDLHSTPLSSWYRKTQTDTGWSGRLIEQRTSASMTNKASSDSDTLLSQLEETLDQLSTSNTYSGMPSTFSTALNNQVQATFPVVTTPVTVREYTRVVNTSSVSYSPAGRYYYVDVDGWRALTKKQEPEFNEWGEITP